MRPSSFDRRLLIAIQLLLKSERRLIPRNIIDTALSIHIESRLRGLSGFARQVLRNQIWARFWDIISYNLRVWNALIRSLRHIYAKLIIFLDLQLSFQILFCTHFKIGSNVLLSFYPSLVNGGHLRLLLIGGVSLNKKVSAIWIFWWSQPIITGFRDQLLTLIPLSLKLLNLFFHLLNLHQFVVKLYAPTIDVLAILLRFPCFWKRTNCVDILIKGGVYISLVKCRLIYVDLHAILDLFLTGLVVMKVFGAFLACFKQVVF